MPGQVIRFNGFMNTDDNEVDIISGQHTMALNGTFRGNPGNYLFQNIPGNSLIVNVDLPAGNNECIGGFFDALKQRIIWFNFNSNANHGIYLYSLINKTVSPIIISGTNTDGDVLNFTLTGPIYSGKILYGDATQGDILYFNNSQKQPCKININRALASGYGIIERPFLNVIKAPPIAPPYATYEDDALVTVNNMYKYLFKAKYRYWYDDKEKSVFSSHSEVPLPANYIDSDIDKDPTKNARIAIVIQTGPSNVKKIEVAFAISQGTQFGDFFQVHVIDKAAEGIPDNDIMIYRFYNDQSYVSLPVAESIQQFDFVPLEANDLELLNGNVLTYVGIKEGYDIVPLTAIASSAYNVQNSGKPLAFVVSQSGNSGFGTGNIHVIALGAQYELNVYIINTTNETISYVATFGATTATVIAGLSAAAITAGFTVISSDIENLIIVKTGESLQNYNVTVANSFASTDIPAYDWNSVYSFSVEYQDANGIDNGAITTKELQVRTVGYTLLLNAPSILLSINSRPPLWAKSFQILRSLNLTKSRLLQWVSNQTFKDTASTNNEFFAYIGIENLNTYIKNNPSSSFLTYNFIGGDRIRFFKKLSGLSNPIYANQDFEIQQSVINPVINGITRIGQFVKIALPNTDINFDFGTSDYYNYLIEIYTPAKSVADTGNTYFEFGERYAIGNPGTVNAFHQGMLQNQTANLSQPATFEFLRGDDYYRTRNIEVGEELVYQVTAGQGSDASAGRITVGLTLQSSSFTDTNLLTGTSPYQNLIGFNFVTSNRWIINTLAGTYHFRIRGTIVISFIDDRADDFYTVFLETQPPPPFFPPPVDPDPYAIYSTILVPAFDSSKAGTYSFNVDTTFTMTGNQKIFIFGWSIQGFDHSRSYAATNLTISVDKSYSVSIIDPNFSDFFQSAVNSNGRANAIDPDTAQRFIGAKQRWAQPYDIDTNVNQANRFYSDNQDTIDSSKGSIMRVSAWQRDLYYYQERGVGRTGIYAKYLQSNAGNANVVTTDQIITSNNVNYLLGIYGMGIMATSLMRGKNQEYFIDPVRGYLIRRAQDGLQPLNELFKGQYFIRSIFTPYAVPLTRPNGGIAKIMQCYDYLEEQLFIICQGGTDANGNVVPDYTFTWNEKRNSFCSFYSFAPDAMVCAQDVIYTWKDGQLYIHNNTTDYCNFFGTQYDCTITMVFNINLFEKKTWQSVSELADVVWSCPEIITSLNSYGVTKQTSILITEEFSEEEGMQNAVFRNDANIDINNGPTLKGNWIKITFKLSDPSKLHYLSVVQVNEVDSPLTRK